MRRLILPLLLLASTAAILVAACTADVKEGCLTGGCPSVDGTTTSGSGGAGGAPCGAPPKVGDFPCEVFDVIHRKCNPCHNDPQNGGAPFALLTYEDTQQAFDMHGKLRYQRMHEVIQPDGSPHMPFKSKVIVVPPLTDAEFKTLSDWTACATATDEGKGCECTTPTTGMGCTALPMP